MLHQTTLPKISSLHAPGLCSRTIRSLLMYTCFFLTSSLRIVSALSFNFFLFLDLNLVSDLVPGPARASTTCCQLRSLPSGSFFHRFTNRTHALQISPVRRSFSWKQSMKSSSYFLLSVNLELEQRKILDLLCDIGQDVLYIQQSIDDFTLQLQGFTRLEVLSRRYWRT